MSYIISIQFTKDKGGVITLRSPGKPVLSDDNRVVFVKRVNGDLDCGNFFFSVNILNMAVDEVPDTDKKVSKPDAKA